MRYWVQPLVVIAVAVAVRGVRGKQAIESRPLANILPSEPWAFRALSNDTLPSQPRASAVQSNLDIVRDRLKPQLGQIFEPILPVFMPNPPAETCENVSDDLDANEATRQAYIQFVVILGGLSATPKDELLSNGAQFDEIVADKNVKISLEVLGGLLLDSHGMGTGFAEAGDLVNYMERIIRCLVDQQQGRTIIQKLVEKGMEKSLKTPFAEILFRGTADYDPSLSLDAEGNNLMHLAVRSEANNLPEALLSMEMRKNANANDASRKMNAIYWLMATLRNRNYAGFIPIQLCRSAAFSDKLKRFFRSYTSFLKIKARRVGIPISQIVGFEQDFLATSSTVAVASAHAAGSAPAFRSASPAPQSSAAPQAQGPATRVVSVSPHVPADASPFISSPSDVSVTD